MSVTVTQPKINIREALNDNKLNVGIKGKEILESNNIDTARALTGAGRKNLIINGNFSIWQRGITFVNLTNLSDRWKLYNGGGAGSTTITRESDSTFPNYLKFNQTIGSTTNDPSLYHNIEYVNSAADCYVAVSFYAKSNDNNTTTLTPNFTQYFGVGGSPSSEVNVSGNAVTLTDVWKRYTSTIFIPSISGKTLGDSADRLQLQLVGTASTVYEFDIANVQVEIGNIVSEFEERSAAQELKACQRYYQKSYDLDTIPGAVGVNEGRFVELGTRNSATITPGGVFETRMRAQPVMTLYSRATGASGMLDNSGNGDVVAVAGNIGETGWAVTNLTAATLGDSTITHYTAEAEL